MYYKSKIFLFASALMVFGTSSAFSASAHIVLEQQTAVAGSYYKATLRVSHGCSGSATKSLTVFLPEGFQGARPMPKPGWGLEAPKEKLVQAYESHGKTISEDVRAVTWSGNGLPDAFFDEFSILGKLPAKEGAIYFKVLQECEQGKNEWFAVPEGNKKLSGSPLPAAQLKLLAPEKTGRHH